jgi:hypothetical protein
MEEEKREEAQTQGESLSFPWQEALKEQEEKKQRGKKGSFNARYSGKAQKVP